MKRQLIKTNEQMKSIVEKQFKVVEKNGLYQVVRMYSQFKERVFSTHIIKDHAENEIKSKYQYI